MQELEKILEEIGELRGQAGSECTSEDHYIKKAWERCLDRVVGIIRKHMNDGWIPVEKYGLPKDEGVYDLTIINGLEEYVGVRWQFLSGTHLSGTQHYVDGMHYWADNYRGDPINEFLSERVIAWRKKSEPYRPKNESLMLENGKLKVKGVKQIAEITICGVLHISVNECDEHTDFIVPTPEQRKNLKEMLCIDVKVFDEERSAGE